MVFLKQDLISALYVLAIAAGEILEGVQMGLMTNSGEIDEDTVITQPTFTGYALTAVTYEAAVNVDGQAYLHHDPVDFAVTADTDLPQIVTGAVLFDADDNVIAVGYFDESIPIAQNGQHLHVTLPFIIDPNQDAMSAEGATV